MYAQLPGTVTSISRKQHPTVTLEGIDYCFIKTGEKFYFGWETAQVDGRFAKIATPEKALIDLVQFHRTRLSVNLVAEKLAVYENDLDFEKLTAYLQRSTLATLRIFGLLLDKLGVDTQELWAFSRCSTTVSRLAADSSQRDSRWHLMYDGETLTPITAGSEFHGDL
jgi:predicted transcriptional regulator of viral defense system